MPIEKQTPLSHGVFDLAVDPSERLLATVCSNGEVFLVDIDSGDIVRQWEAHAGEARSVAFSPDGQLLATGGSDGLVRIWNVDNGSVRTELKGHAGTVWRIRFSPDGKRVASGGVDGVVNAWNVISQRKDVALTGLSAVYALSFSPDGRRLVTGDSSGLIRVWMLDESNSTVSDAAPHVPPEVLTLVGHSHNVWDVVFSPDGQTLVSAGHDESVRFWNAAEAFDSQRMSRRQRP